MMRPPLPCLIIWRAAAWERKKTVRLVDVDDVVPVFFGEIDEVGTADDAGVVDEDVDVAEGADTGVDDFGDVGGFG